MKRRPMRVPVYIRVPVAAGRQINLYRDRARVYAGTAACRLIRAGFVAGRNVAGYT